MALINPQTSARGRPLRPGFKTSIIALFVAIVLVIGLALVYLSFERITAVTNSAAGKFIDKVAELSADRIGFEFMLARTRTMERRYPSVPRSSSAPAPGFAFAASIASARKAFLARYPGDGVARYHQSSGGRAVKTTWMPQS